MLFAIKFFPIPAWYHYFLNGQILINHGLFFQEKEFLEHDRLQFLK